MLVKVTEDPIDVNEALQYVRHASCGAVATFEGNIRNENDGETVIRLHYEVYEPLLHKEVNRIASEIRERWPIYEMALIQRIGWLDVGDIGIVISVSSGHRREGLDALSYAIEEFKKRAPVWKKESTTGGDRWINWD
jgi:molybdopterin synthase catalytic subunit